MNETELDNATAPRSVDQQQACSAVGAFDRDEAFWQKIRTLPDEVKSREDIQGMLLFKSKAKQLNRDIEDAIELRLAGWTASLPSGPLDVERVFAWQWRRPGPKGGRLFLSTQQARNALRKGADSLPNVLRQARAAQGVDDSTD